MTDSIQMPQRPASAFEQTLNGTGFMIHELDDISTAFVEFASRQQRLPSLDIGAAFGVATLQALARGASMIANDIDPRHLSELERRTPEDHKSRLQLVAGSFPGEIHFGDGIISSVLVSRVMHFFSGIQVMQSIKAMYRWLTPGGKAFIVTEASIFLSKPLLARIYEERKATGERWPGYVANVQDLLPRRKGFIPNQLHYLDPEILQRAFTEGGFEVEHCSPFTRTLIDETGESVERVSVGLIARKI